MSQEITAKLDEILKEQGRQKRVLEDIQNELIELDKDHLVVDKLKSEVSGMRDDLDRVTKDIKKHQRNMAAEIQDAVEEGVKPATQMAEQVARGLENGAIPVSKRTADGIKRENFIQKFTKKWSKKK